MKDMEELGYHNIQGYAEFVEPNVLEVDTMIL